MIHIIERFLLHFVCSTFCTLGFFFGLRCLIKRLSVARVWLSSRKQHLLVTSALIVFALFTLREPFDIYFGGQLWYKAVTDQISWFLGPIVSVWGLSRFDKLEDENVQP